MNKWLIGLFFFITNAFSQTLMTKVIDLNYSQADKIIPLIQPLLQAGEQVTGSGQTLIIKVSPETLTQLRLVLHKLDQPPTTFQITIHQGDADWLNTQADDVVSYSSSSPNTRQQTQSVNVINGASAFVSTGGEVPIVSSVGAGWNTGVAYEQHKIETGLMIEPHLQGSQVKITVQRIREQQNLQAIQQFDNQQINTTMMVPLDKWVSLGSAQGANVTPSDAQSENFSAGNNKFSNDATLYIKVSVLTPH